MLSLLILLPEDVGVIPHEPQTEHSDLLDQAFLDAIRALDRPRALGVVLAPWSVETAPLLAAATLDTAPHFDPEVGPKPDMGRSGVLLYRPPSALETDWLEAFERASHLFGPGETAEPLTQLLHRYPPTHVLMLGMPSWAPELLRTFVNRPTLLVIGEIMSVGALREQSDLPGFEVDDISTLTSWRAKAEHEPSFPEPTREDAAIEPFLPVGLLIEAYFARRLS